MKRIPDGAGHTFKLPNGGSEEMTEEFWLSDGQWARLAPLLLNKPRVDDRRVISGIIHVLKSGCRWADAPPS